MLFNLLHVYLDGLTLFCKFLYQTSCIIVVFVITIYHTLVVDEPVYWNMKNIMSLEKEKVGERKESMEEKRDPRKDGIKVLTKASLLHFIFVVKFIHEQCFILLYWCLFVVVSKAIFFGPIVWYHMAINS